MPNEATVHANLFTAHCACLVDSNRVVDTIQTMVFHHLPLGSVPNENAENILRYPIEDQSNQEWRDEILLSNTASRFESNDSLPYTFIQPEISEYNARSRFRNIYDKRFSRTALNSAVRSTGLKCFSARGKSRLLGDSVRCASSS